MISEYEFWKKRRELLAEIKKRLDRLPSNKSKIDDETLGNILWNSTLNDFIYKEMGVVGGAFILANKPENELFFLQNSDLQRKLLQRHYGIPFIEIPYKYNRENIYQAKKEYKDILDAMFISSQDRKPLLEVGEDAPEIYKFLPKHLSKEQIEYLLPFERKLVADGINLMYCTIGEVIFHLYLWRYLFRLGQTRGLNSVVELEGYDSRFENKHDFWDSYETAEKARNADSKKTPEYFWLRVLRNRRHLHESEQNDKAYDKIYNKWVALKQEIDEKSIDQNYSFYNEYLRLGLIKDDSKVSRALLELVRYSIYIAQYVLNWEPLQANEFPPFKDENKRLSKKHILYNLYILERRLERKFALNVNNTPQKIKEDKPTFEDLQEVYQLDECLQTIFKHFLFHKILKEESDQAPISLAIKELHNNTRFPILPFFYELASGNVHDPKEYLILDIWNSPSNPVKIKITNQGNGREISESAVAFVALTLRPIWETDKNATFSKNGDSIHWCDELSEETFNSIFRLLSFFSVLSRPLIDKMFYGQIIKKEIERQSTQTDINAFSHEMGKVVDNIFKFSNIKLIDLLGKDAEPTANLINNFLYQNIKDKVNPVKYSSEDIVQWRVIPDFRRFSTWNKYLNMWTGRSGKYILEDLNSNANLQEIVDKSYLLAAEMFVAAEYQNEKQPDGAESVRNYSNKFKNLLNQTVNNKKITCSYNQLQIRDYQFLPLEEGNGENSVVIGQNAILRILIASITNIFEHTTGHFHLYVRIKTDSLGGKAVQFSFINPCKIRDPSSPQEKSLGTKPVLESCLALVGGILQDFRVIRLGSDGYRYWSRKLQMKDGDDVDLWLTSFMIPLDKRDDENQLQPNIFFRP